MHKSVISKNTGGKVLQAVSSGEGGGGMCPFCTPRLMNFLIQFALSVLLLENVPVDNKIL